MNERFAETDFVGFWKRVLIVVLDVVVLAVPSILLYRWSISLVESLQSEVPIVIRGIVIMLFYIFMVIKFGGTPGRLILKTRIVNEEGNYPTVKQALIRYCFFIISYIFSMTVEISSYDYTSFSRYVSLWADLASDLDVILGFVVLVDCLIVVVNIKNQALHDMMAGTYVVYKSALDEEDKKTLT